jgi:hypothetical protein
MSQATPTQHDAVVLRSHYVHLRALLAVALVAMIGLTLAIVIVATNTGTNSSSASPASAARPATSTPYNPAQLDTANGKGP